DFTEPANHIDELSFLALVGVVRPKIHLVFTHEPDFATRPGGDQPTPPALEIRPALCLRNVPNHALRSSRTCGENQITPIGRDVGLRDIELRFVNLEEER